MGTWKYTTLITRLLVNNFTGTEHSVMQLILMSDNVNLWLILENKKL
jgi:hypothetical protein